MLYFVTDFQTFKKYTTWPDEGAVIKEIKRDSGFFIALFKRKLQIVLPNQGI